MAQKTQMSVPAQVSIGEFGGQKHLASTPHLWIHELMALAKEGTAQMLQTSLKKQQTWWVFNILSTR